MTKEYVSLEDYTKMHDKAKRLLEVLTAVRSRITTLTGQNGMSPAHDKWIQSFFEVIEHESLWKETEEQ